MPGISFRTVMKPAYECTFPGCNKQYARVADLQRHYRGSHNGLKPFKCRFEGCERAVRGFPRKDKRDDHERTVHKDAEGGAVEQMFFE